MKYLDDCKEHMNSFDKEWRVAIKQYFWLNFEQ